MILGTYSDAYLLNESGKTGDSGQSGEEIAISKGTLTNGTGVGRTSSWEEDRVVEYLGDTLNVFSSCDCATETMQAPVLIKLQIEVGIPIRCTQALGHHGRSR